MTTKSIFTLYRIMKASEVAYRVAQAALIGDRAHGETVADTADGTATVCRGETRTADVVAAKRVLSAARFKAVTETKVSLPLLDAALKAGRITQAEYDEIVKASPKAAYLKITLK